MLVDFCPTICLSRIFVSRLVDICSMFAQKYLCQPLPLFVCLFKILLQRKQFCNKCNPTFVNLSVKAAGAITKQAWPPISCLPIGWPVVIDHPYHALFWNTCSASKAYFKRSFSSFLDRDTCLHFRYFKNLIRITANHAHTRVQGYQVFQNYSQPQILHILHITGIT